MGDTSLSSFWLSPCGSMPPGPRGCACCASPAFSLASSKAAMSWTRNISPPVKGSREKSLSARWLLKKTVLLTEQDVGVCGLRLHLEGVNQQVHHPALEACETARFVDQSGCQWHQGKILGEKKYLSHSTEQEVNQFKTAPENARAERAWRRGC